MELSYAIARYEQALELLPMRWQQAARRLPDWRKAQAEEFRLRTKLVCNQKSVYSSLLLKQL